MRPTCLLVNPLGNLGQSLVRSDDILYKESQVFTKMPKAHPAESINRVPCAPLGSVVDVAVVADESWALCGILTLIPYPAADRRKERASSPAP